MDVARINMPMVATVATFLPVQRPAAILPAHRGGKGRNLGCIADCAPRALARSLVLARSGELARHLWKQNLRG
jgi:hypothetical protein